METSLDHLIRIFLDEICFITTSVHGYHSIQIIEKFGLVHSWCPKIQVFKPTHFPSKLNLFCIGRVS